MTKAPVGNADFLAGSLFQDRVCIRSKRGRKALQQHVQSMMKKSVPPLTGKEFEAMTADLKEGNMPSLQQFLEVFARDFGRGMPQGICRFLMNVSKSSSACGLIQIAADDPESRAVRKALDTFCHKEIWSDADGKVVRSRSPVIADFIDDCAATDSHTIVCQNCG